MKLSKEFVYFSLIFLASLVALFKTGLVAYVLTPENFGYFTLFLVITGYFQYSQLGILNGLGRELPISYGKESIKHSLELVGVTFNALLVSQFFFLVICTLIVSFLSFEDNQIYLVILLSLISSVISNFYNLSMLRLRSELRLVEYSVVNFIVVVLGLCLTVYLAYKMGYLGAIIGTIISFLLGFIYTNVFILDRPILKAKKILYKAKNLMMIGSPLLLSGFIQTSLFSMDKIILSNIYAIAEFGIYAFSSIPLTMGIVLSGILATYFTPKILHKFGSDDDLFQAYKNSRNISLLVIIFGIIFYPVYYLIISFALKNFFPDYIEGKELMVVFYIPALFISANLFGPFLVAAKKFTFIVYYELSLFILVGIIYGFILYENLGMIYFPSALAAISICGFIFLFFYSRRLAYNILTSERRKL